MTAFLSREQLGVISFWDADLFDDAVEQVAFIGRAENWELLLINLGFTRGAA